MYVIWKYYSILIWRLYIMGEDSSRDTYNHLIYGCKRLGPGIFGRRVYRVNNLSIITTVSTFHSWLSTNYRSYDVQIYIPLCWIMLYMTTESLYLLLDTCIILSARVKGDKYEFDSYADESSEIRLIWLEIYFRLCVNCNSLFVGRVIVHYIFQRK